MNAFSALLLGLKMLPAYGNVPYDQFFESFKAMPEAEKEKMIREASLFVELSQEEIEAIISFATDKNGIPYGPVNLKNLGPQELHEIITAVCMEIGRIEIGILSDAEKKKLQTGR